MATIIRRAEKRKWWPMKEARNHDGERNGDTAMNKAGRDPYGVRSDKRLSPTQQWEVDHPGDVAPRGGAAWAWRRKRGLDAAGAALRRRYEAAMAATRAARAARGEG
jgi:hypothetical protein